MATHGRLLVKKKGSRGGFILYSWHDGHTKNALTDIISLPYTLFDYGREMSRNWHLRRKHTHGPWYYDQYLGFALSPDHHNDNKRWDLENLLDTWRCSNPLTVFTAGVANWITWVHFDRWTIVPNLKHCSYPGKHPDIIVDVDEREDSLIVTVPAEAHDEHAWEAFQPVIKSVVPELNARIPDEFDKIEVVEQKGKPFPKFVVPVMDITLGLLWKEIQWAYDVIDGKAQDNDGLVHAIVAHHRRIEEEVRAKIEKEKKEKEKEKSCPA
jgi:hypothetical protein